MPVTKRTTKAVSYNEQDDDDDFIPIVDINKKTRNTKQPSRKQDEKLSKHEDKEPELVLKHPEGSTIENPIMIEDKENSSSQSTVSSNESKTSPEKVITEVQHLSPKCKRMKYEEEDNTDEEEPTAQKDNLEETVKMTHVPIMTSIDLNTSRTDEQNSSNLPTKRSSAPLGFPTSKINIPSPHVFRVGLSRKSSTIKPLHPNFSSRVVPE